MKDKVPIYFVGSDFKEVKAFIVFKDNELFSLSLDDTGQVEEQKLNYSIEGFSSRDGANKFKRELIRRGYRVDLLKMLTDDYIVGGDKLYASHLIPTLTLLDYE